MEKIKLNDQDATRAPFTSSLQLICRVRLSDLMNSWYAMYSVNISTLDSQYPGRCSYTSAIAVTVEQILIVTKTIRCYPSSARRNGFFHFVSGDSE